MWPFKKDRTMSFDEYAMSKPVPKCGDHREHYYWTDFSTGTCPKCKKIEEDAEEYRKQEALAERIAEAVITKLRNLDNQPKP